MWQSDWLAGRFIFRMAECFRIAGQYFRFLDKRFEINVVVELRSVLSAPVTQINLKIFQAIFHRMILQTRRF